MKHNINKTNMDEYREELSILMAIKTEQQRQSLLQKADIFIAIFTVILLLATTLTASIYFDHFFETEIR